MRSGLSQEEVGFLLGRGGGAQVCRHERFNSEPGLRLALAYEVIFQKPVRELFPGIFAEIEEEISKRAKILNGRATKSKSGWRVDRRHRTFKKLIENHDQP
jgi:hypothetical protein